VRLYGAVDGAIGSVRMPNVRAATARLIAEYEESAGAAQQLLPAIREAQRLVQAEAQGVPFRVLKRQRTALNQRLDQARLVGKTDVDHEMEKLFIAMTDDMTAAARNVDPKVADELTALNRQYAKFINEDAKVFEKLRKLDATEKAYSYAVNTTYKNARQLQILKNNLTEDEFGVLGSTLLQRMGRAKNAAQDETGELFSPNTFMTNWSKMGDEAKDIVFGNEGLRNELDELVKLVATIKKSARYTNTSNTTNAMQSASLIQAAGVTAGAFFGGDVESATVGFGAGVVAPRVAARLLTNQAFVRWLATPAASYGKDGLTKRMARLASIAQEQPELTAEVQAYVEALKTDLTELRNLDKPKPAQFAETNAG